MAFAYTKLMQAMVAAGVVSATDPYFNLVTLLLPGNGTNGAQNNTFLDSSTNNFTITRNGNTTQGTFSPFSQTGWSNYIGSGNYLSAAHNTALDVWVGDFTVEAFVWSNANQTDYTGIVTKASPTSGAMTSGWQFCIVANKINVEVTAGLLFTHSTTLPNNSWAHVVLVKSGSTVSLFQNGTRVATITNSSSYSNTTSALLIGVDRGLTVNFNGYISNARLVKGTAVYDATQSTLTVPTAPLTAVTNTSLLTCQSNRFIDNSSNAFAITVTGTPSVQAFSPFAPTAAYDATTVGGSGYFDGTGDYLSIAGSSSFSFTGDFTVEGWFYNTSQPQYVGICSIGAYTDGIMIRVESNGSAPWWLTPFVNGSAPAYSSTRDIKINTWYHMALVRSGTTVTFYINGKSVSTFTVSGTVNTTNGGVNIGSNDLSQPWRGYLSGFRIVKGTAVYTADFTVPTAPPTAVTNTLLLTNFTNAGITDATAKNIFETVGNASISTAQSKFGGGSMFFDGTGDYLTLGNTTARSSSIQVNSIGTANATIEMWVYSSNSSSSLKCLIDTRSGQGTDTGYGIYQIANNVVIYGNGVKGNAAGQLAGNTWTHLAVTRANTTNYVFIGGTLYNTFTYGNTLTSSNVTIASDVAGSNAFTGYIDDLRITNGYARYTANFTVTTTTFPLQ